MGDLIIFNLAKEHTQMGENFYKFTELSLKRKIPIDRLMYKAV